MLKTAEPAAAPAVATISPAPRRRGRRILIGALGLLVVLAGVAVGAVVAWSDASLVADSAALARVDIGAVGGTLTEAHATSAAGAAVPLVIGADDRLTPKRKVEPGQHLTVEATITRPGLTAWALGRTRTERIAVTAPRATVTSRWLTVQPGQAVAVTFDQPVAHAGGRAPSGQTKQLAVPKPTRTVALGSRAATGSLQVSSAPRDWERLGPATTVSWFPASDSPIVVADPSNGSAISPSTPVRLTFSEPVSRVLGSRLPAVSPSSAGRWSKSDSHTLTFHPSAAGLGLGASLQVALPKAVAVATSKGTVGELKTQLAWTVPPGSTLRLQQLLAQAGYLPVDWKPDGDPVARTQAAQNKAAVDAPKGTFSWRYPNTPPELKKQWTPGQIDQITRGAVMMFQDEHGLDVDAAAGQDVWKDLIADTIAGKRRTDGYSYVYVHRDVPQKLTLWHNGKVILTSPGNTGIPAAPTELGTFPVFEHLAETTMSGTNPDGSHYNDPGIKWVSYFNGGDALHTFNRASFGTPQSLGCVELPESAAKKVYPYTPIGTLVTIEH